MMKHSHLRIDRVFITHAGNPLPTVDGLSLDLPRGAIGCLLGASGCGKTTLLQAIAGFLPLQDGSIELDQRRLSDRASRVLPEKRRVGMVFQDFALFPHLNAADNVAFGLPALSARDRRVRVTEMLALVNLDREANRFPHELSGGQQQRVALARALAPRPALLLLDEPFSSLDVDLRERLTIEVREILRNTDTTALLVTHDQREAFSMCDFIGVMNEGRLEQWDTAYNLYHRPETRFVADFVGEGSFLPGLQNEGLEGDHIHVETELGFLTPTDECAHPHLGKHQVDVLIRPDDVVHDDAAPMQALVTRKSFRGADFLYTLQLKSGRTIQALVPSHHDHPVGNPIGIRLQADHVITFPREAGE